MSKYRVTIVRGNCATVVTVCRACLVQAVTNNVLALERAQEMNIRAILEPDDETPCLCRAVCDKPYAGYHPEENTDGASSRKK